MYDIVWVPAFKTASKKTNINLSVVIPYAFSIVSLLLYSCLKMPFEVLLRIAVSSLFIFWPGAILHNVEHVVLKDSVIKNSIEAASGSYLYN